MKILEQTTRKNFEVSNIWLERLFNTQTNRLEYCVMGVYQDCPKASVILGRYGTDAEQAQVFNQATEAMHNHAEKFIMPDRED